MAIVKENSGHTKQYKCPACDELCDTKAEARKHCEEEIEVVYSCDLCFEEFDTKALARACCPEWVCSEYGDGMDDEDHRCPCMDDEEELG